MTTCMRCFGCVELPFKLHEQRRVGRLRHSIDARGVGPPELGDLCLERPGEGKSEQATSITAELTHKKRQPCHTAQPFLHQVPKHSRSSLDVFFKLCHAVRFCCFLVFRCCLECFKQLFALSKRF